MNKRKFGTDWSAAMNKIKEQAEKKGGNSFKDERVYYPQFNDNGTAQAIIRFLPSPDTDVPFVSVYSHSIKGPGGWYIENCPTTLKQECPVCKANSSIWDSDPDLARSRKRKQSYLSNILVIKDPANPENEGKVFLYKYGKKVHDRIMEKIQPSEDSIDEPVMIFDYYDGADFKLIIKKIKVGNIAMPNYDSCQFDAPSQVGTDEEIEKVHNSLYGLTEFVAPASFKPYDELESKFNRVVGINGTSSPESHSSSNDDEGNEESPKPATAPKKSTSSKKDEKTKVAENTVFEGNDDQFFKELQEDGK